MSYDATRDRLEHYFDRTAAETWARLTSEAPVSRIRATVRAGRDRMREILLSRLPADLHGARVLDAGCGVGQLSVEAARRGAEVVAVDIAPSLLEVARDRLPADVRGRIRFLAGDMLDPALGHFDHVVAMDSLIHYRAVDIAAALARLADRTARSVVFTVAPSTPALQAMHVVGKAFPRSDRSPAIVPISAARLKAALAPVSDWRLATVERVRSGFYISEALELLP
jgi:magnesium-protoporphyrin O-methyltransferase